MTNNYNDYDILLKLQLNLLNKIQNYKNKFIDKFITIIYIKTGERFNFTIDNDNFIFYNNSYKIIHNNNIWFLYHKDNILIESINLNDIIYKYLLLNNKLSLCLYKENIDNQMEELTNLINNLNI
jgi:hypothetical protein